MKNLYISTTNNVAFPIEMQYKLVCTHFLEPFEFIILNGGNNYENMKNIDDLGRKINVTCVQMPDSYHSDERLRTDPSRSNAAQLNFIVQDYIRNKDIKYLIISHADAFPICNVSVIDILQGKSFACQSDQRVIDGTICKYVCPIFMVFDVPNVHEISSLNFNNVYLTDKNNKYVPLDCGGMTYTYINKYANSIVFLDNTEIEHLNFDKIKPENGVNNQLIHFLQELKELKKNNDAINIGSYCYGFYHFLTGSRWMERPGFDLKINLLNKYFL